MSYFNDLNFKPELLKAIQELSFSDATAIQQQAMPVLLEGKDVIGQAKTGTGKTAAFGLPMLQKIDPANKSVQGFILAPTRELALQVSRAMESFAKFLGVRILAVYGGQPYGRQLSALTAGVQVVVGTPGRVLDLIQKKKALDLSSVKFLVLDEADEMLKMGFIEDVETIFGYAAFDSQKALFSATMPAEIRSLANNYLHTPEEITVSSDTLTLETTEQRIYLVRESDKFAAIKRLLEVEPVTTALVFTRTKVRAGELADQLIGSGFASEVIHGDLSQSARELALSRFRRGVVQILVATDVAARGLDIQGVSHVFNYDLPFEAEEYIHRIGRTGRAGESGVAISLVTAKEVFRVRRIEKTTGQGMEVGNLPGEREILNRRREHLQDEIVTKLAEEGYREEIQMVQRLADLGYDPMEIAAAAMQMVRAHKKYPKIDSVGLVDISAKAKSDPKRRRNEERSGSARTSQRSGRKTRIKSQDPVSHEKGMVRLSMSLGKMDQLKPTMVVGAIANEAQVPGKAVGAITIHQNQTFVDVSEKYVDKVIRKLKRVEINGKSARLSRAA